MSPAPKEENALKKTRFVGSLAAILVLAALTAGTALSKTSPFLATYAGHVTEAVNGQDVTATASGKGTGKLVKASTIAGIVKATTANPPCSPLSGPGTIKGPSGVLKLNVLPTLSHGCAASEDDQNDISFSGSAKVTGGTKTFKKARGTLHFSGHYDRGTGAFTVKITGRLTY